MNSFMRKPVGDSKNILKQKSFLRARRIKLYSGYFIIHPLQKTYLVVTSSFLNVNKLSLLAEPNYVHVIALQRPIIYFTLSLTPLIS